MEAGNCLAHLMNYRQYRGQKINFYIYFKNEDMEKCSHTTKTCWRWNSDHGRGTHQRVCQESDKIRFTFHSIGSMKNRWSKVSFQQGENPGERGQSLKGDVTGGGGERSPLIDTGCEWLEKRGDQEESQASEWGNRQMVEPFSRLRNRKQSEERDNEFGF